MINQKHLHAIGLASTLLITVSSSIITVGAKANSLESATIIADNHSEMNVIAEGNFVTVEQDHPTAGQAQIVEENGQRYLKFDADFTTARGPDVNVVMHRNTSVPVNLQEEYIILAPLQSFDGAQQYLIPDDFNLDEYQSVAIWCRQFNVTFGYATL